MPPNPGLQDQPKRSAVRDLLLDAFDTETFQQFFFYIDSPRLQPVDDLLRPAQPAHHGEQAIRYCEQQGALLDLLEEVKRENAYQYNRHKDRIFHTPSSTSAMPTPISFPADLPRPFRLDRENAAAYNNRGVAHYERGDLDAALDDLNRAIELDPQYAFAYNNRGLARKALDELDATLANFNQAIQLTPKYAFACYNRALVYEQRDEKQKAIADFIEYLELGPDPDLREQAQQHIKALSHR